MRTLIALLFAALGLAVPGLLQAQTLNATACLSKSKPFGVALIRLESPEDGKPLPPVPDDATFELTESTRRTLYPVYFREVPAGSTNAHITSSRCVLVLFKGDKPLEVKFSDGQETYSTTVPVQLDETQHAMLLSRWWSSYPRSQLEPGPNAVVGNYLSSMLSRRLGLKLPRRAPSIWDGNLLLGNLLGFEEIRLAMQSDTVLKTAEGVQPLDQVLPAPINVQPITIPEKFESAIEPLAHRVPAECFYARFNSLDQLEWFRRTVNKWGGNLRNLTATRSLDYGISARLEHQLALNTSELRSRIDSTAVTDLALIGMDTFLREGATFGVLLQVGNDKGLSEAIQAQRETLLKESPSIRHQTLQILGRDVSLLQTDDNTIRSFFVVDGEFVLVTNSSTLTERFLQTRDGESLADLKEFGYARSHHPAVGKDAILMYLSDPFVRQMVGPAYRVEMARRMTADIEIELFELARLAARNEQQPHETIEDLIAGHFLPEGFGKRPDGSQIVIKDGVAIDSLRGARRSFIPVADVKIDRFTRNEATAYQEFSNEYRRLYQRMDPVSISIERELLPNGHERIQADLSITPFTRRGLGAFENWLSPSRLNLIESDENVIIMLQAGLKEGIVFGGVLDRSFPFLVSKGTLVDDGSPEKSPPVFFGEHAGKFLRNIVGGNAEPDSNGEFEASNSLTNFVYYGLLSGDFWMRAGSRQDLKTLAATLRVGKAERHAQIRATFGDLGASRNGPYLRAQQYLRERDLSQGNARMLDTLTEQLGVPDLEALTAAEAVLGAKPVCTLGGEFVREPADYDFSTHQPWYSTAWLAETTGRPHRERIVKSSVNSVPADYIPSLLDWFHGLKIELNFNDQTMLVRFDLDVSATPENDAEAVADKPSDSR